MKNFIAAAFSALFLFVSVNTFAIDPPKKSKATACSQSSCSPKNCNSAATLKATTTKAVKVNKVAQVSGTSCPISPDCVCIPIGSSCVCVPSEKVASVAKTVATPIVALASTESKSSTCPNTPGCVCE